MHKGDVIDKANGYSIIDCAGCGFIHIDPVPEKEELDAIYKEDYYKDEKPLYIDYSIEDSDWWRTVYDDRYDIFEAALRASRRRILDIGCGPGYFLKRGMERGWECLGVEPSRQAAAHTRGLGIKVINSFLDEACDIGAINSPFDAIHLSEVLEHTADPEAILACAYDLMGDGGVICCVVPNDYSPVQKVLREELGYKPYWLAPPHHINYFSFDTLKTLMEKTGFAVTLETAMFPMDFFLLMGENYVGDDEAGRRSHAKRKRLDIMLGKEPLKAFKREMYALMARHSIGREMVIFGQKGGGDG